MNLNTPKLRSRCAAALAGATARIAELTAFVGLDGFVDEILHVVDKRQSATAYDRMLTITQLAERLAGAAGKSTNIEFVPQLTKLGGNGPIMANALASMGLHVTYLGNLGYPNLHPVFAEFAQRAAVHSIAQPGFTDAIEFEDGKVMLGKHTYLKEVNWENITTRFGRDRFAAQFRSADLVGFVNWTMLTHMSDIWAAVLQEICPTLPAGAKKRTLFFDLADPEKRTAADIQRALDLILAFRPYFDVILGLNEKEAYEIARVLGLDKGDGSRPALAALAAAIHARVPVQTLVVHPVPYALCVSNGQTQMVEGLYTTQPRLTTGAGDHFNSGFCLGKLLGLEDELALLTGVTASGYYVIKGQSPSVPDLVRALQHWPAGHTGPYAF
ncbi:MAG TPA: PfkB family carbohydrate kinase [Verrucomicrobiota bacterium]|jgi:sugar/nucleoside kinase (ribokinase family)|nr:MAG: pfkB family carbohydrate kinase [Verrucomicrobia bacterium ADurb.Bin118]HPY29522.1 PfkB family carbohydrate kinase [Verrucomicrobiota bacterium]HQB15650.1 PfkB family carbohydrate kinase [Verrucomicrobiota bacterium]